MKRIWNYLHRLWMLSERKPWQFLQNLFCIMDKDPPMWARTSNEADNKILDEWMEEYKGRINTPEAREEYRRRVFRAATEKK